MKWIGITGGIATGKSTVSRLVESRGFKVIDADRISHQLTTAGAEGYHQIIHIFGESILDAQLKIDRKKLADIVFNQPAEKLKLESILHPLIKQKVVEIKNEENLKKTNFLFYDVPLLFENNLKSDFDLVITVWCEESIQLQRLMSRSQLTLTQAEARLRSQFPLIEKVQKADYCIDNSGPEVDLLFAVDHLLQEITGQKFQ
jgi:dephospho-CoA kinase